MLNAVQAAELLGVSVRTMREWLRLGRIPGRRVGKLWLISEAALMAFLAEDSATGRDGPTVAERN